MQNVIQVLDTHYIKPNLTVELIMLASWGHRKMLYVRNQGGLVFKVFESITGALENEPDTEVCRFDYKSDLEDFLDNMIPETNRATCALCGYDRVNHK